IMSHPDTEMIGEHEPFSNDARANIFGAYYTEETDKYIEPAILAIAPIYAGDEAKQLSGVVKVGYFESKIIEKILAKLSQLSMIGVIFIVLSFFISRWFGKYIKSETLGYEPKEITMILKNRENIFSARHEGIIGPHPSGKTTCPDGAARKYLGTPASTGWNARNRRPHVGHDMDSVPQSTRPGIRYFETKLNDNEILVLINDLYEKGEL